MTEDTLSMGVRRIDDAACVLDIEGDITAFSEEALMDAYTEGAADGVTGRDPELHRARVHELRWDRAARDRARAREPRRSRSCSRSGSPSTTRQIFELTRLDEAIGIYATEADALAAAA